MRRAATTLAVLALAVVACGRGGEPRRPDVLLVILDTVRADHLSSYGYERPTTPHLDRLASEGERYADAWAQSSWTLPAIASILTGLPPHRHGADRGARGLYGLRPEVRTLAERMTAAGYATAAFFNVLWLEARVSSLDRGYAVYDVAQSDESNRGERDAARTNEAALAWVDAIGDAPFLLTVHYFDPHLTYDPPAPFDTMFERGEGPRVPPGFGSAAEVFHVRDGSLALDEARRRSLVARYDGEIRYADEQLGRLRAELERRGRWERTLVVVVGDHGEEFWEHGGFEHGHSHHRELLHVPLVVRRPGGPAGVVREERVRQVDIVPTVLAFAGLPADPGLPGRALGDGEAAYAVAEGAIWRPGLVSVRAPGGSVILDRATGDAVFYAPDDRWERTPLPAVEGAGADLLDLLRAVPPIEERGVEPRELDPEQLERLRSLGYVGKGDTPTSRIPAT